MNALTGIRFAGQMHHVRPRLATFLEIEDELGSLAALARLGPDSFRAAARDQAALALARAESGLTQPQDLARLRAEIAASAGPA